MKFHVSNDEHFRCHRLLDVINYLIPHQSELKLDVFLDIEKFEDYKGVLCVYWHKKPDKRCEFWVQVAWASLGETFDNVRHIYPGVNWGAK